VVIVGLCWLFGVGTPGCGQGTNVSGDASSTSVADNQRRPVSTVAQARVGDIRVFPSPDETEPPTHTLANPTENGGPLVFLVEEQTLDWLHVDLPVRPNGSTGWIRASDVIVTQHEYSIVVELAAHHITVRRGDAVILSEPVGVGTSATPTPGGRYYIKELLEPPDPNTVYGPYAYGLSGFSNALTSYSGAEAVIGLHGNNDPSSLGRDVSHGCIRISNTGITFLAKTLPLGTPVEIVA
jgi:lipoprotein-anchoring transpeptidase ErfK/SrfK